MIVTFSSASGLNPRTQSICRVGEIKVDRLCFANMEESVLWASGRKGLRFFTPGVKIAYPSNGFGVELTILGTMIPFYVVGDIFVMNDDGKTIQSHRLENPRSEHSLRQIMDDVTRWFQSNLMDEEIGKRAREYLIDSGVPESSWKGLRLGYAPRGWQKLLSNFIQKYGEKSLLELDLVVKQVDKDSLYDKFRDKVIYPVTDKQNRVVRFIGQPIGEGVRIESKEHESFK